MAVVAVSLFDRQQGGDDMHDAEVKIRLTDKDVGLLRALARRMGIPTAVLARSIVRQALHRPVVQPESGTPESRDGRP